MGSCTQNCSKSHSILPKEELLQRFTQHFFLWMLQRILQVSLRFFLNDFLNFWNFCNMFFFNSFNSSLFLLNISCIYLLHIASRNLSNNFTDFSQKFPADFCFLGIKLVFWGVSPGILPDIQTGTPSEITQKILQDFFFINSSRKLPKTSSRNPQRRFLGDFFSQL